MEDEIAQYEEVIAAEIDGNAVVLKRKRGANLKWKFIGNFMDMAGALEYYTKEKLIERELIVGKVARSKTTVYNYSCNKRYCGCTKQYRLTATKFSTVVVEEETMGDHSNHDKHQRNSGRGLSFKQNEQMEDALRHNCRKPMQVIDFFEAKKREGIEREG